MPGYSLQFPIRVPDDVLVELGEFTGHFWSDSLRLEPFVIEAIRLHGEGTQADSQRSVAPERIPHDMQPPPSPKAANRAAGAERVRASQLPTVRPASARAALQGNGIQHKFGAGRSARRRKRRAAKHIPENP
ncbi:hypothetical protein RugamoR64_17970 [Duganella rhizosphaerae]|uniref:hypothetical protein n=1 Tax=Duganella rhizosphaerae TaxID=2885763 RepID=UPI0030EB06CD